MMSPMKKLLGIVVLVLLLISCAQQSRDDEYSCMLNSASKPRLINITEDRIITDRNIIPIKEETSEKIYGVLDEGTDFEYNITFYTRTKKIKEILNRNIFISNCTQLN